MTVSSRVPHFSTASSLYPHCFLTASSFLQCLRFSCFSHLLTASSCFPRSRLHCLLTSSSLSPHSLLTSSPLTVLMFSSPPHCVATVFSRPPHSLHLISPHLTSPHLIPREDPHLMAPSPHPVKAYKYEQTVAV